MNSWLSLDAWITPLQNVQTPCKHHGLAKFILYLHLSFLYTSRNGGSKHSVPPVLSLSQGSLYRYSWSSLCSILYETASRRRGESNPELALLWCSWLYTGTYDRVCERKYSKRGSSPRYNAHDPHISRLFHKWDGTSFETTASAVFPDSLWLAGSQPNSNFQLSGSIGRVKCKRGSITSALSFDTFAFSSRNHHFRWICPRTWGYIQCDHN